MTQGVAVHLAREPELSPVSVVVPPFPTTRVPNQNPQLQSHAADVVTDTYATTTHVCIQSGAPHPLAALVQVGQRAPTKQDPAPPPLTKQDLCIVTQPTTIMTALAQSRQTPLRTALTY